MSTNRTITVELGDRSYPIVIGRGLLGGGFALAKYSAGNDCLIVSNETVAPLYSQQLTKRLHHCIRNSFRPTSMGAP